MKLIAAGIGGTKENFLFNCTRNHACQKTYFIPIPSINEIMQFYADLPGLPDTYSIAIINDCDELTGSAVSGTNVVGQKPDLTYYGVFGDITPDTEPTGCFYFKFTFTISGQDYIFFTDYFCINRNCYPLMLLQGCYPNEPIAADASDCNGIYYGFTNGDVQGTENYRYFHWAYVRDGEVNEQKNKLSFVVFNSKKAYKNTFSRETLLQFELVPTFYKNTLIGIFNRGNIRIDGNEWRLSEEQEISMIDTDSKLWKADILLAEECKQYFGCGVSDCTLPVPPDDECCSPSDVTAEIGEEEVPACCSPDIDTVTLETTEGGGSGSGSGGSGGSGGSTPVEDEDEIFYEMDRQTPGDELGIALVFASTGQTGTIDWGDGSALEPFNTGAGANIIILHTYALAGNYGVRIACTDPSQLQAFGDNQSDPADGIDINVGSSYTALGEIYLRSGRFTSIPDFSGSVVNSLIMDIMPLCVGVLDLTNSVFQTTLITFPNITSMANIPSGLVALSVQDCATLVDIPAIPNTMDFIQVINCPDFTGFTSSVIGDVSFLAVNQCNSFNQLLTLPAALFELQLTNDSALSNIPAIPSSVQYLTMDGLPLMNDAGTIPNGVVFVNIQTNAILDTINFGTLANCNNIQVQFNILSSAQCDSIYSLLVANGISGGVVNTANQTPPATLSPAGLADKATLAGNGWTCTSD